MNRGTLILLAPNAKGASISPKNIFFAFQYNPEKLLHTFNQAAASAIGANPSAEPTRHPNRTILPNIRSRQYRN